MMKASHRLQLRRTAAIAAAVLLGLLQPASAQTEPIVFDVIVNQTGSNAFAGTNYIQAMGVFEGWFNKRGGLHGRPVHFEIHDDQSNPQTTVQLMNSIVVHKPNLVYGPAQTATCAATAPVVLPNGPVAWCFSPGLTPPAGGYVFAASVSLANIEPAMVRFLRLKGCRRIGMLATTDASGQATEKSTYDSVALGENKDVQIVAAEHFNVADSSVAAQVARIKAAEPTCAIVWAAGGAFGTAMRALNDAGLDLPVMTTAANLNPSQLRQFARVLPTNVYFNGLAYTAREQLKPGLQRDRVDQFYAAFRDAHQEPTPESGFAWDPLLIGMSALEKLGLNVSARALRDYLVNLHDFAGIGGIYDFRRGDQHGLTDQSVIIVKWDPVKQQFTVVSRFGGTPIGNG
jgi:branched-chain amino acid transport system substrate-binding protein